MKKLKPTHITVLSKKNQLSFPSLHIFWLRNFVLSNEKVINAEGKVETICLKVQLNTTITMFKVNRTFYSNILAVPFFFTRKKCTSLIE